MSSYASRAHHAVVSGSDGKGKVSVYTYQHSGRTDIRIESGDGDAMHIEITAENRARLIAALEAGNEVRE